MSNRREAIKFLATGAAAAVTAAAVAALPSRASAASPGPIGDYDFIIINSSGTIEAYDPNGNLVTSGSDWGAVVNELLTKAPPDGVWIHTKSGIYLQSTSVSIPSSYNATVTLSGQGMARTPQAKFTSPRPSTIIKNTQSGGKIIVTPGAGQPALFVRDMTLFNAGGGVTTGISFQNALEGGLERVMVTQVDPTVSFVSEPSAPALGSIGINLATGTGKNLFRLQEVYIINYDTGLLINSDWVCADQLEFNWCNTRCVDIEGGFYQEFRFLHSFDSGGTMVYDNKSPDTSFERELTVILGLADEGKGPSGYVAKTPSVNNVKGAFLLILGTFNPAGTGVGYVTGQTSSVFGLFTDLPSAGGGSALPGPVGINSAMKSLNGSTAGTASYTMPFSGPSYKRFLVYLNGYQNATATAQAIAFPAKFTESPAIVVDATQKAIVSNAGVSLPSSMSSAITGWIIIEGY